MVAKSAPSNSGVVVTTTASTTPMLKFLNFSLRCDKSDPQISFETPWNWDCNYGKRIAVISSNSYLRYQLVACMSGLVSPVSGKIVCNNGNFSAFKQLPIPRGLKGNLWI